MAAEKNIFNVMHQFELKDLALTFTNSNLWMVGAAVAITLLMTWGMSARARVPGRMQNLAESAYGFVHGIVDEQVGHEGRKFFPFVFTLFMFVLFGNLLGMIPYSFTYTSHIAVTFALAAVVFITTTVVAIMLHGWKFFTYFVPHGAPKVLLPLIVPIEIISYLSRLVSLSVRLFANMMAGHVMLKVFAGFIIMLGSAGGLGYVGAVAPLAINVALIGFEFLVAFLQAYVFAILTSIYLHDAVHLH
jgi:F-type H+-transporting ATPase subunit a